MMQVKSEAQIMASMLSETLDIVREIRAKLAEVAPASANTQKPSASQIADCMVRLCGHIRELSKDQIADNILKWSRQLRQM